jgi:hypothetical protein
MDTPETKAADVDRAAAVERLQTALNEGRLTVDEYDTRLREAYSARTYGELDRLLADLPSTQLGQTDLAQPMPHPFADGRTHDDTRRIVRRWMPWAWRVWALSTGVNVAIWAAVSLTEPTPIYFWPIWVGLPSALVLLGITLTARRRT